MHAREERKTIASLQCRPMARKPDKAMFVPGFSRRLVSCIQGRIGVAELDGAATATARRAKKDREPFAPMTCGQGS
jgi:hypothetical protein